MVGELKKGRYIYYHCTEARGRCDDPYVREEKLIGEMARAFQDLVISPATMCWLAVTLTESDRTEVGAREQSLRQLKAERDRLQSRIETMYLDRLDGRTSAEFFDVKSQQWREEQKQVEARMLQLSTSGLRTASEAVQMMKGVSQACAGFSDAQPEQSARWPPH